MTLEEARNERKNWRALVKAGKHPARERDAEKLRQAAASSNSFGAVARQWMEKRAKKWSAYYAHRTKRHLENDVFPQIGHLPINAITAARLRPIILCVEERGAETVALALRQLVSEVFKYAVAGGMADGDPAAALTGLVERPMIKHRKPLAIGEIPVFVRSLDKYTGATATKIALKLLLLTFVRPSEMAGAEWSEISIDTALWRIPAPRMKARRDHVVPLSTHAVELLRELHDITGGRQHLFPNYRDPRRPMGRSAFNAAFDRMGYVGKFSPHAFRATASTHLNELGYRGDLIELQLAHTERDHVRASYNHADYLAERRQMMQVWSDLVLVGAAGNVVAGKFGGQHAA